LTDDDDDDELNFATTIVLCLPALELVVSPTYAVNAIYNGSHSIPLIIGVDDGDGAFTVYPSSICQLNNLNPPSSSARYSVVALDAVGHIVANVVITSGHRYSETINLLDLIPLSITMSTRVFTTISLNHAI
jgi:hypothetical protein